MEVFQADMLLKIEKLTHGGIMFMWITRSQGVCERVGVGGAGEH